jgi:hypothetical protein
LGNSELDVARYAAHVSLWALYVSVGAVFISACVFALELRRWFDEGVRLSMSVMIGALIVDVGHPPDPTKYLSLTVTNRGSAPTTITNMVLFNYPSYLAQHLPMWLSARIKRFRPEIFVVMSIGAPGPLPYLLEPGRIWNGKAIQTLDVEKKIDGGGLYVGVVCSHNNKTLFKHVQRWRPPPDAKVASRETNIPTDLGAWPWR